MDIMNIQGSNSSIFASLFNKGSTLEGKNLLLQEQILSFKRRLHVNKVYHPMKETRIHASSCKWQGVFIRAGAFSSGLIWYARIAQML